MPRRAVRLHERFERHHTVVRKNRRHFKHLVKRSKPGRRGGLDKKDKRRDHERAIGALGERQGAQQHVHLAAKPADAGAVQKEPLCSLNIIIADRNGVLKPAIHNDTTVAERVRCAQQHRRRHHR